MKEEDDNNKAYRDFVEKHKDVLEKFSKYSRWEDSGMIVCGTDFKKQVEEEMRRLVKEGIWKI